jgi:catechol 2,3-dioxygenase-like lactoylglutathione lyase family enzyme
MQFKHTNLATPDVSATAEFFERFFKFEIVDRRGEGLVVMRDQDNFVLTLMKLKKSDPDRYPQMFHIGFYVESPEQVNAKHAELSAAGVSPDKVETPNRQGAVTTFYCTCPGGITVEVCTPPSFAQPQTPAMAE